MTTNEQVSDLDVVVDEAMVAPLVARLDVDPGPLCPVQPSAVGAGAEHVPDDLAASAPLATALALVATARDAARLRIVGGGGGIDLAVWFGPEDDAASLRIADDGLHIESPAPAARAIDVLVDLVGESTFVAVDLEVELEPTAAVVFAALFDEARRDALRALADGTAGERRARSGAEIAAVIHEAPGNGLLGVIRAIAGVEHVDDFALGAALEQLRVLDVAHRLDGGFGATGATAELASRCFALQAEIELTRAWVTATGDVERASCDVLLFGPRDLLAIERVGQSVRIATESALGLVECARSFLTTSHQVTSAPR